jgi:hypothetical protein
MIRVHISLLVPGTVVSVRKGDPHESVSVEWDVDGCFPLAAICCALPHPCQALST